LPLLLSFASRQYFQVLLVGQIASSSVSSTGIMLPTKEQQQGEEDDHR
jgi:hypothetical protein